MSIARQATFSHLKFNSEKNIELHFNIHEDAENFVKILNKKNIQGIIGKFRF